MPEPMVEESESETTSVFLTKAQLGRVVKVGDSITFTVKDVDPETGDVELTTAEAEEEEPTEPVSDRPDVMSGIDELPE